MTTKQTLRIGRLHVLTDYRFQQRFSHVELARLSIDGGADTIQFRHKSAPVRHALHELEPVADLCLKADIPLIVDDDVALAMAVGAAGVHVGQHDLPVDTTRSILGRSRIIGATVTSVEQALNAEEMGADYVGFGPVYGTKSKGSSLSGTGTNVLSTIVRAVHIPVIAIAGITRERVRPVLESGAHGIAVMTYVSTASNPVEATRRLRDEIDAFNFQG